MARWIGTYEGVPPSSEFGTTRGEGTPLVIDTLTGDLYYLSDANVVTLAGGGGGGGGLTHPQVLARTLGA